MKHEEQKDPVAYSTSAHSIASVVDVSDRENKEIVVVEEEESATCLSAVLFHSALCVVARCHFMEKMS